MNLTDPDLVIETPDDIRRRSQRYATRWPAFCRIDELNFGGTVLDISIDGAFLSNQSLRLEPGQQVQLTLMFGSLEPCFVPQRSEITGGLVRSLDGWQFSLPAAPLEVSTVVRWAGTHPNHQVLGAGLEFPMQLPLQESLRSLHG